MTTRRGARAGRALMASAALVALPAIARAQAAAPATAPPSCTAMLDGLRAKIEANYAGHRLEVARGTGRAAEYQRVVAGLRERAARTDADACYPVLRALTGWFADPHLFVFQSEQLDSAESRRRAAAAERTEWTEARVRDYLARNAARLDPIEGIWYDGPLRIAVVPERPEGGRELVGVVLTGDAPEWQPGMIRARIARDSAGGYAARLWSRNFAVRQLEPTLHRGVVLRWSPGMWGKEHPVSPADVGAIDQVDVHRPTLRVRDGTVIVAVPSHDPRVRPALDSLVARHEADLRAAERLIVDLRGNEGGAAFTTRSLLPYVVTERRRPTKYDGHGLLMLSSPDQLAYARRAFGSDTTAFVRSLVARLEASPGGFVPLQDPALPPATPPAPTPIHGPRQVAVLVDRGTVSAAEVLVLDALRSERALVVGEPTAGALDYQSTSIVPIAAGQRRWYLGYPTITASERLPANGMRGTGIAPDVRMDPNRPDLIEAVEAMLKGRR